MPPNCWVRAGVCWLLLASLVGAQNDPLPRDVPQQLPLSVLESAPIGETTALVPQARSTTTGVKPAVQLEIRLIELPGDCKLPMVKPMVTAPPTDVPSNTDTTAKGAKPPVVTGSKPTSAQILTKNEVTNLINGCQENRRANVLAAPRLMLPLGEKGQLRSGGEVAYVVPETKNETTGEITPVSVRTEFVGIAVDATVTSPKLNQLQIDLMVEHSELTGPNRDPGQRPAKTVTRMQSKVACASGESVLLSGFHNERMTASVNAIPVLSDLPVIGTSFMKVKHEKSTHQLLVLVTPVLVDESAK